MALQFTTSYVEDSIGLFRYYKTLAESALAQVTEEELYALLDEDANSIAIVMKHMAGNMKSRWTDFLSEDGEKPWRNRDTEFEQPPATRQALLQLWEEGWACVFAALQSMTDAERRTPLCRRSTGRSRITHITVGRLFCLPSISSTGNGNRSAYPKENLRNSTRKCGQAKPASDRCWTISYGRRSRHLRTQSDRMCKRNTFW